MKLTAQCHNVVDNPIDPSVPPVAVLEAIRDSFPKNAEKIISELRYHHGDDFWSFNIHGMFVGCERDGYIHS
jgi:hypothetical protein